MGIARFAHAETRGRPARGRALEQREAARFADRQPAPFRIRRPADFR
jgi:hypothetical protein